MLSKPINPNKENKRNPRPMEKKSNKQKNDNIEGTIRLIYSLDLKYFGYDIQIIKLFGEYFLENNKDKCKMSIEGKEYEIKEMIKKSEFKDYGINEKFKVLQVILKGEGIKNMSYMFSDCESLIKVDLSSFNTQNVTDISYIFNGCKNLIKLDLSSFDTQNVAYMQNMCKGCKSLIKVDLSSFNTQNVTSMSHMFNSCKTSIKIIRKNFHKIKIDQVLKESRIFIIEV